MKTREHHSWLSFLNTPGYNAWRGNAFEVVCLNHIPQIKQALGVLGVETQEFAWKSSGSVPGAQIDLLIDRKDGVINLCEMKFTNDTYEITKDEAEKIMNRLEAFRKETETMKAIHVTLVTANGIRKNKYSGIIQNIVTGDHLFE